MIKHCPTCDRTSDKVSFIGEFCEVCVSGKLKEGIPDRVIIERCKSCERVRTPTGYGIPDKITLRDAIKQGLHTKFDIKVASFDWRHAVVRFSHEVDGNPVSFERSIALDVKKTMCLDCYRKTSGYYEAIFQLRGPRDSVDRMMKRFTNFIETRGAFISRIDELGNGYDIYMSDKKLASAFFEHYELKPKRSYILYGLQRGKKVYRNTYMLRVS